MTEPQGKITAAQVQAVASSPSLADLAGPFPRTSGYIVAEPRRPSVRSSSSLGDLAGALSKAQAAIRGAAKDRDNPHFRSKYADLASVWDACREALAANQLSVAQSTAVEDGKILVVTVLMHASGEWMEGVLPVMLAKTDMQALGSGITYARRYALAAMVGVAPEDDDGEAAVGRGQGGTLKAYFPSAKARNDLVAKIRKGIAEAGSVAEIKTLWDSTHHDDLEKIANAGDDGPMLRDTLYAEAKQRANDIKAMTAHPGLAPNDNETESGDE